MSLHNLLISHSSGLGYNGKDDEWIKHYEGFEDVLTALNSEHNSAANSKNGSSCNSSANSDEEIDQKNKKSLEVRSKVSKARVQYVAKVFYRYYSFKGTIHLSFKLSLKNHDFIFSECCTSEIYSQALDV